MANGFKTGGRQKGTPNKLTQEMKPLVEIFLRSNWAGFCKDYQNLEVSQKVKIYEKLLSYALPKDFNFEVNSSIETPRIHIIKTIIDKNPPPLAGSEDEIVL